MTTISFDAFEWDSKKASENEAKHGVTFVEALSALVDVNAVEFADDAVEADRVLTLGMSNVARVSIERGERTRIISARKAKKNEQALYGQGAK